MKSIRTDAEVLEWAKTVVDAKGEKFTALSKGDQYAIARYIVAVANTAKAEGIAKPTEPAAEPKPAEGPKGEATATPPAPAPAAVRKVDMSMGCALHIKGLDAQKAYDCFIDATKDHPKDRTVVDFSTGAASQFAAFAYWLTHLVSVEVTPEGARA